MQVGLHKCGTGGIAKASPYDPSPKHGLHRGSMYWNSSQAERLSERGGPEDVRWHGALRGEVSDALLHDLGFVSGLGFRVSGLGLRI